MEKREQLKELINCYADGNQTKFAAMLGLKQGYISSWINRNSFNMELIAERFPDISAEWLLRGEGSMLKRNDVGMNIQGNHNITAGSNITIGGTTTDRCENCAKPVPLITTEISRLPDVDVMQEIKDGELDISHTLQVQQFGDYTAAYVVQNDAMGESFVKGDRVAIKYQSFMNVINGNIYVVDSKRGMFLRRAYELDDNTFMFRSDNPQLYSDMKMSKDEVYSLFVVVGLLRILY